MKREMRSYKMKKKFITAGFASLLVFIGLTFVQTVFAATFTVTKFADTNDGVCDTDCSLREAIGAANSSAGADNITIPAGTYTLSIAGTGEDANATGDLDVTGGLTINGAGAVSTIIDGGGIDRVLTVHPGATDQINAVTIRNGNPGAGFGAAGILNSGKLTLSKSSVTNNTGDNFGGGIYNVGTITLIDTTVSDNILLGFNLSGGGGGIFSSGTMTMTRTTVSGNSTIGRGGGIYNLDQTLTIINSTISGNTALNGGGIFNRFGTVNLTHVTLTGNTATDNGGGIWNFSGTATLANTIVSGNSAATAADDCAGGITSLGYNLAGDASCTLGGTGDLNSTNPLLGPLADNGGQTLTHALFLGSPAIDAVPLLFCTVTTDQRGVPRPQGAACEIGSFEIAVLKGRMTGGGSISASIVKHGFELSCDTAAGPNNLEVNWGKNNKFQLENLTGAICSDSPVINEGQPVAGFDTYVGTGTGWYNGAPGATAVWTFTDAGEPGSNDLATLTIKDVNNVVILTISATLKSGNHQSHKN